MRKRARGAAKVASRGAAIVAAITMSVVGTSAAGLGTGGAVHARRLDDVRVLGTHNSYHVRPDRQVTPGEEADYAHPPLSEQLAKGIRALELDAWNAPTFPVFHSLILDDKSTCPELELCLREIARWSKAHPEHETIFLYVEAKTLPVSANPSVQSAIDAAAAQLGITSWDAAGYKRLDVLVRHTFGSTLITPDDVRGKHRTLRAAVLDDAWPTIAASRGKVITTLIGKPEDLARYRVGAPSLQGRALFTNAPPTDPAAALISRDVPDAKSGIPALVRNHFIVKTRADANGVEARANDHTRAESALKSGAQIIFTDYPEPDPTVGPYEVTLPPSR
jgi:hypothetical protein